MTLKKAGDDDFDEKVIEASEDKPVIVDFWADWCMACKQLKPTIEEVAEERDDVDIVEVNVDEAQKKPQKYGVRSIPNVNLFIDGELEDSFVGNRSKEDIIEWIDENV